jgi:hypothetical protein
MSDPFKVSVLDIGRDVTTIDGFETAGRANRHVERINVRNDGLHAEYIGDSRDRVYAKKAARVAEVQADRAREAKLLAAKTARINGHPKEADMSAQYTPGQWKRGHVNGGAKGMDGKGYAICAGPHVIARVTALGYPIGQGSHPESDANADLLAAAPKLLNALQNLIAKMGALECKDIDDVWYETELGDARAAIAEAARLAP